MNDFSRLVNQIYEEKIKPYAGDEDRPSEDLQNQLYGEAIREAQIRYAGE